MAFIRFLLGTATLTLAVPLIAGLLGRYNEALDSFSHFRMHLLVAFLFAVLVTWTWQNPWLRKGAVALIAVCLLASLPHLPGFERLTREPAKGGEISLIQLNLSYSNAQIDLAKGVLRAQGSDFVVLQEVTATTEPALLALKRSHPFQLSCRFGAIGSVAIASRHPFVPSELKRCLRQYGLAAARFTVAGRPITIASYHSYWPWPFRQNSQIAALQSQFSTLPHPVIIGGDFNAAPWSAAIGKVAELTRTRVSPGYVPSWRPTWEGWAGPFPAGLAIDHTLFSAELTLTERFSLPFAGSDHLPVLNRFQWIEPVQSRSAKNSNKADFNTFPVDEAGKVSATMMRAGLL